MTHITLFSDAAYTESKEAVVTDGKYMVEGLRTLTPAERDALTRTATSRSEAHGLVTRAQIVLDCASGGVAEAARRSSVSPTTATKWWRRFTEHGLAGLHDAPRTGRPSSDEIDTVLEYALFSPPEGGKRWSTRAIAQDAGLSQATVSRIRRRVFEHPDTGHQLVVSNAAGILSYVEVGPSGCVLGFSHGTGTRSTSAPGAALVDAVETIFCAALLTRPFVGHPPRPSAAQAPARQGVSMRLSALLERAAGALSTGVSPTLLVDTELDPGAERWLRRHPEFTVRVLSGGAWFAAVHRIADELDPRQTAELQTVQERIRAARAKNADSFSWVRSADHGPSTSAVPIPTAPTDPVSGDLGLAMVALCAAISGGELRPGDEIPPRTISRRTGLTPTRVSETLSWFASEALLDRRNGRYWIPMPSARDIIETYTARGLLGTAIARRLADPATVLPPALDAYLDRLGVCHEMHLTHDAYMIDLDFQNELARCANMPRIGSMFVQLSLQLRLFVTVIGLDYQYPTDEIVTDGRRLVRACQENDAEAAVAAWRQKTDNCVRHMLRFLDAMASRTK